MRVVTTRSCSANTAGAWFKLPLGTQGTVVSKIRLPSGTGYGVQLDDGRIVVLFDSEVKEMDNENQ